MSEKNVSLVLYCLIRRKMSPDGEVRFLVMPKPGGLSFPATKYRQGEDIYSALVRPMEEDLGLPPDTYFPEEELPMIQNAGESPRYPGLSRRWYLYPVDVSLRAKAMEAIQKAGEAEWLTLDSLLDRVEEPNLHVIGTSLKKEREGDLLHNVHPGPSMDALASHWSARNEGGVRILRKNGIEEILDAGSRALNLRVADPYLAYQKQGLGFTWSFFTFKDRQDVHVHGMPAVEIYGILEGEMLLWEKPMNQRGARVWTCHRLGPGDWAEVAPLNCHFACWVGQKGLGTVIKAAASGKLAGVGKIGEAGKTVCKDCSVRSQCLMHPLLEELSVKYGKPYGERDYDKIAGIISRLDE